MTKGRSDLWIALVAAVAIAALAYAVHVQDAATPSTFSTFDRGPNGYAALFAALRTAGVPVRRLEVPLARMTHPPAVLVVSSARRYLGGNPLARADRARLAAFVRRGGRLVVLAWGFARHRLALATMPTTIAARTHRAFALVRDADTADVIVVRAPSDAVFRFRSDGAPLLANRHGVVALRYRLGRGDVIAIAAPQLWSNRWIGRADNARFAYDVLAHRGPVAFDEYVQGYARRASAWNVIPMSVKIATALALVTLVVAVAGANLPFAGRVPAEPPDERGSAAYLDAIAALLRRGGGARSAIAAFARDAAARPSRAPWAERARDALAELRARDAPTAVDVLAAARLDYRLRKERG